MPNETPYKGQLLFNYICLEAACIVTVRETISRLSRLNAKVLRNVKMCFDRDEISHWIDLSYCAPHRPLVTYTLPLAFVCVQEAIASAKWCFACNGEGIEGQPLLQGTSRLDQACCVLLHSHSERWGSLYQHLLMSIEASILFRSSTGKQLQTT